MEKKLYITFYTSAEAMATKKISEKENIEGRLVPVPRVLSSGCGISFETLPSLKEKILNLLEKEDIEWEECKEI